ncbi:MAG: replication initiation factor domain-containing protein [Tetragenococcus koreensis]|nr:replication initiation factor domain-containing protein [Tetragenococcus koreensis]MDN6195732.1 replication initiation factor domain-containing protein [Atopostipes suicloacalis]MDN6291377.1 replication initiation factor domain-containing protein [Tetragenococcus koreensis]MDN6641377.1 replication initiation factor domain-containing protein [Tetragenococcus sp.]
MSKKIKTLKNWDFLVALSNRRLSVGKSVKSYKLDWSIDRITIVGKLAYDLEELGNMLVDYGFAKESYSGFNLVDRYEENVAYFETVKFHEEKGRIDFNPNKLGTFVDYNIKNFIHQLFIEPHFSRADVACDIYNLPDELIQQYTLADAVSYRPIYGRSGELETMYWGSRGSERQVRLYNKYIEQGRKKQYIHEDVKSWWRLEVQLRRAKANEWDKILTETLDSFSALEFMPLDWSANDKIMLSGLRTNHNFWNEIGRDSKYKYRKMLKEIAEHDELTTELKKSFTEYQKELKDELDSWLRGIDVTEN